MRRVQPARRAGKSPSQRAFGCASWLCRLVLALATLLVSTARAQPADDAFRVGLVAALTGPIAELSRYTIDGAKVEVAALNQRGGIGGLPVKLVICDTQSTEQQALLCTRRLISDDKVHALIGANGTPATLAVIPAVEQAGVPLFALAAGKIVYDPLKKWVFKAVPGNEDQNPLVVAFAKRHGWRRIALIRDNGAFGRDVAASVQQIAKAQGVEIVADETYSPGDTDVGAQVTRIRGLHPDAVFNFATVLSSGALVSRKLVQLGVNVPIFVQFNLQLDAYSKLVPEAVKTSYFVGSKATLDKIASNDPLYPNIVAFVSAYKKQLDGAQPNFASTLAVDPLLLLRHAGETLGRRVTDHDALRLALEQTHDVPGVLGVWSFSPSDHGSNLSDGLAIVQYQGGKWVVQP